MRKMGLFAVLVLIAAAVHAQTAEVLDRIFAESALSFAQASRLVLGAAEIASPDLSDEECFSLSVSRGWIPASAEPSRSIRLDEFSRLSMAAFGLGGGYLYRFFPGPRYAYREMVYKKYIQGRGDPAQTISGVRAVRIIGRVLDARGESL